MATCPNACSRDTPKLARDECERELTQRPLWRILERDDESLAIVRAFTSKNWSCALAFLNAVSVIAEREGHHPDVKIKNYRDVVVELSTHAIGGVSAIDFRLAKMIDDECEATYSPKWARDNGLGE
ncbi:Transcriptional coactivator/pterin dehydratase [Ostreococcus tauri]|nr:Transcriptional coactivator/pterin dehydratase [Ostreococcus tauri]CEG00916.1 Transcriptional coactivator/pterin dehydratase [Ostreococcus tauri]|eukprot:XP_003074764.2 Transcriptional coactivator/pterin dehydratase [Ostreococcus tauri]